MRLPPPVSFDPLNLDLLAQSRESVAARRHAELMRGMAAIHAALEPNSGASKALLDQIRTDLREALKLKEQLDAIAGSIQRTKQEIATLHSRTPGGQVTSVTDELGAVVCGTEAATNCILAAAEEIDEITGALAPRLTDGDAEMAQRISDKVITIFEACNFQDITGQRISKVVNSMKFIEERVTQMAHIWGGLESFSDVEAFQVPEREGDEALLNGPALDGDPTRTSQDDIDALFG
ncbi:protein phosphatase CheZ [Microvirga aerilata]|uniref:Protein phosphatase CheZ n=1 Tax=Microvirga aerilata TaxID=670292 RepID=A0A937D0M7_9HYPH|nr:protein phosphatase CheZ [Microvirga aerilata]MBL0406051.1 protein phosphatase CheZ [Microvirga aerilata]